MNKHYIVPDNCKQLHKTSKTTKHYNKTKQTEKGKRNTKPRLRNTNEKMSIRHSGTLLDLYFLDYVYRINATINY